MINYQLVNPLVDDCKLKHPFAFEISMLIVPILYDRYGLYLNEDEVSFLTLYVLMMLNVKNVKLKVLLVNSMQKSFSNFIENWIKSEYAEYINIVGVCPVYRIQEELLASNVDLIISDTVLDVDEGVPYIVINHLPGSLEKEEINNFIFRKTGFFSINKIFSQMFSEKNILIVDENLDFLDLMKKSANILKAQECIDDEEQFLDNLISREMVYSTHICNGCFMPHPLVNNSKKSAICVVIQKGKTKVNNTMFKIGFILALEPKINNGLSHIYEMIYKIASSEKTINYLLSMEKPENCLEYLENIAQILCDEVLKD